MVRSFARAAVAAALGALLGPLVLSLVYQRSASVELTFDQLVPRVVTGFHGAERTGERTFAWTGPQATVRLPGIDRRGADWQCSIRLRGGRAPGVTQPSVSIDVDGVPAARATATNLFQDIAVDVPASSDATKEATPRLPHVRDGLTLTIASAPTFVPGPGDRRELGVQVDHIVCAPAEGRAMPPRAALLASAIATTCFAMTFVAFGAPLWLALLAATAVATAQALALSSGPALYTPYLDRVPWLAGVIAATTVSFGATVAWQTRRPMSPATRFGLAYSAVALYLLLLAVLHPSKALVDAVFHAHRLEWVHAGRYFFTQPMPSGVAFPYAIGLYIVSLPWMSLTGDHVALLRIVVCTAHILAGLLLYAAIVRRWQDRLAGALSVVLWSLVPQWFVVVGNANLTAAFAQAAATATLASAAWFALGPRDYLPAAVLFMLTAVALLSHVGTFPLLLTTLGLLALACWWIGDRPERSAGRWIATAAVTAAIFSVVAYYGHFGEVYKSLDRVTGRATSAAPSVVPDDRPTSDGWVVLIAGRTTPSVAVRATTTVDLMLRAVGWPIALLCLVGAWRMAAARARDRLTLTVLAWFVTSALFVFFSVVGPVEPPFYRYTVEYITRVMYATVPAAIAVAGLGGAWAWRAGPLGRVVAGSLVGAAACVGASWWWSWMR